MGSCLWSVVSDLSVVFVYVSSGKSHNSNKHCKIKLEQLSTLMHYSYNPKMMRGHQCSFPDWKCPRTFYNMFNSSEGMHQFSVLLYKWLTWYNSFSDCLTPLLTFSLSCKPMSSSLHSKLIFIMIFPGSETVLGSYMSAYTSYSH